MVNLAFSGTAAADEYVRSQTSITILPNEISASMTLTAVQDAWHEAAETIVVDVDSVVNGTENGTQQVTALIADDDAPKVTLSITGSPMAEAGGAATVTATLSAAAGVPVTINLPSPARRRRRPITRGLTRASRFQWAARAARSR